MMKIVLTGGGTGGHFYPLIAVVEAIEDIVAERKLLEPKFFYIGPPAFDQRALLEHDISYASAPAGKVRRYWSILNFVDIFKTAWGIVQATFRLFNIYPDVIFSTGGYSAYPTLWAARILKIPVVIYDADATPGRVSLWSAKFARYIAIAHPEAVSAFPKKVQGNIARTGHPIRKEIEVPVREGGHEFLKLDTSVPTLLIMGGSQGAQAINEVVLDALPEMVSRYNVIHQAGAKNLNEVSDIANVILKSSPHAGRYRLFGLLNTLAIRMAAGVANLIIARAGSGTIFEIASWGIPAILVPIPEEVSHDQTENAYSYARAGACVVIEQKNLTPHLLMAEINRVMNDPALNARMAEAARAFARRGAARTIGDIVLKLALTHEPV